MVRIPGYFPIAGFQHISIHVGEYVCWSRRLVRAFRFACSLAMRYTAYSLIPYWRSVRRRHITVGWTADQGNHRVGALSHIEPPSCR